MNCHIVRWNWVPFPNTDFFPRLISGFPVYGSAFWNAGVSDPDRHIISPFAAGFGKPVVKFLAVFGPLIFDGFRLIRRAFKLFQNNIRRRLYAGGVLYGVEYSFIACFQFDHEIFKLRFQIPDRRTFRFCQIVKASFAPGGSKLNQTISILFSGKRM